jgi:GNAT superfamily N-acetyltransferase
MTIEIGAFMQARLATRSDLSEILRVTNRAYVVEKFFIDGERTHSEEVAALMAQRDAAFLVIEDPVDRTRLRASVFAETRRDRGHFAMLAVDPDHQGQGLARQLIEAVEEYCRVRGCRHLDLDMVNLRTELSAFYAHFGFSVVGTMEMGERHTLKRPCHRIKMSKDLR